MRHSIDNNECLIVEKVDLKKILTLIVIYN